ncbi:LytR/AlgR family response regulator transcription factor [Reinekea blandensis]|uniref:Alginate biosynthesis regulatory protein AlgR-like protein n=1 Tax=Reinekea blandensis MED297 TaxID=314283 RepID=A4BAR2_9GAMM|nr:LytTR family DNA-binding domain-containing protein [Reinekea blandensis]EAR11018.1 alginate biosynthesis regulatory protein AlgR-like protein [Reinekea sp. MED297] [Reinekea blandensis MED297]
MRVLVVDDEPLARERLVRFLQDIDDVENIATASSGEEALSKLNDFRADVLLLDIRMPGLNGLSVADRVQQQEQPPAIIFCTAYDDHAMEAFQVRAQSYLLKPIQRQALTDALHTCRRLNRAQVQALDTQQQVDSLSVQHGREKEIWPLSDVYFFRAEQKYVMLFGLHGERVVDESLKALEQRFASSFVRVHRNTLIARARVEKLYRDHEGGYWVRVRGVEEPIAVSRRHAREVRALFD